MNENGCIFSFQCQNNLSKFSFIAEKHKIGASGRDFDPTMTARHQLVNYRLGFNGSAWNWPKCRLFWILKLLYNFWQAQALSRISWVSRKESCQPISRLHSCKLPLKSFYIRDKNQAMKNLFAKFVSEIWLHLHPLNIALALASLNLVFLVNATKYFYHSPASLHSLSLHHFLRIHGLLDSTESHHSCHLKFGIWWRCIFGNPTMIWAMSLCWNIWISGFGCCCCCCCWDCSDIDGMLKASIGGP